MATPLKLLIVDDDQLTLEMIGGVLTHEGVDVLGLRDPREGLALIEAQIFDGIFLDLTMPGLNGLVLAQRIRESRYNATTPIVVITGRSDSAAMKAAFSVGAHFFLSKPLDLAKLRRLIQTIRGTLLRERSRNRLVALTVSISGRAGSHSFTGVTSQIGEQGMVCRFDDPPRLGELLHLDFRLPTSSSAVQVTGMVVPTDDVKSTGCQFKQLGERVREALREFVDNA